VAVAVEGFLERTRQWADRITYEAPVDLEKEVTSRGALGHVKGVVYATLCGI
jgi:hypothetical protein